LLKVGFAAETQRAVEHASDKRARRGFDIICANDVSRSEIGFEVENNELFVLDEQGVKAHLCPASKYQIANGLLDVLIAELRAVTSEDVDKT